MLCKIKKRYRVLHGSVWLGVRNNHFSTFISFSFEPNIPLNYFGEYPDFMRDLHLLLIRIWFGCNKPFSTGRVKIRDTAWHWSHFMRSTFYYDMTSRTQHHTFISTLKAMPLLHTAQCTPPSGLRCSLNCLCRKTTPLSPYIFHIVNKLVRQIQFFLFSFLGLAFIRLDVIHGLESIRNAPVKSENEKKKQV